MNEANFSDSVSESMNDQEEFLSSVWKLSSLTSFLVYLDPFPFSVGLFIEASVVFWFGFSLFPSLALSLKCILPFSGVSMLS